jgi:hypothetical protein
MLSEVSWCANDVFSVCHSCHRLQAMGHRATVFPDYHDALWPNPTGRIHRLPQEVSSLGCHSCWAHPGSSSCSAEAMFTSVYVLSHPRVLWADKVCFQFRIMQPTALPVK